MGTAAIMKSLKKAGSKRVWENTKDAVVATATALLLMLHSIQLYNKRHDLWADAQSMCTRGMGTRELPRGEAPLCRSSSP